MRVYLQSRKREHRSQFARTSDKRAVIIFLPRENRNAARGEGTVRGVNNNVETQMEIKVTRRGI